jgi:hypothetical protein
MRYLSPRRIPKWSLHRGSGQAVVRFVEPREGDGRGRVEDRYLGVHGSAEVQANYEIAVRDWIERSLRVGWAPAGWKPAETRHEGVLTVGELVVGYRRYLARTTGEGWVHAEIDESQARAYRAALERAREMMRAGRPRGDSSSRERGKRGGDKGMMREGKRLIAEARRRYGHLDDSLERCWTARVLDDLVGDHGTWAAAVLGDRELRRLREKWAERGVSLSDRKAGMEVIGDAFWYVIGREPEAPWDRPRDFLEQNADRFGLDLGMVGADGRWVRSNSYGP